MSRFRQVLRLVTSADTPPPFNFPKTSTLFSLFLACIGPVLSIGLIAELPELGSLSGRQIAKLVGVAPLARDSGVLRGHRHVWGGRASARKLLYMAALVATRYNPVIRELYQRLLSRLKAKKVALVACMRRLLTIINAMMRDRTPWTEALAASQT